MPAQPQGGREFLDRERDPVRAAGHHAHQVRFRFGAEQCGEDGGDAGAGERSEVDLRQLARPAQLRPGRAQAMISRQLVAAVAADHGDRAAADGAGQGREQVQRRVVGPLQIVEEHGEPAGPRHLRQDRGHRRGQCRLADLGRRRPEPGHDQRQLTPWAAGIRGRDQPLLINRPAGDMGWPLAVGVRTWASTSYTADFRPAAQPRRTGWPAPAST